MIAAARSRCVRDRGGVGSFPQRTIAAMSTLAIPTVAEVARIAAHLDPVLRNVMITHCYHELALGIRAHTGAGANWCTFATWASRQAGRTIRREDLRQALLARLGGSPDGRRIAAGLLTAMRGTAPIRTLSGIVETVVLALELDGALDRAAAAVAAGNLKVFEEIAEPVARLLEALRSEAADTLPRFLDELRPGDPPAGQRLLRDAFEAYREAADATSSAERAQLLYYGNLLIGMHEQTRLQPEIAAAMNATFDRDAVRDRVIRSLLPGVWRGVRYRIAALFGRRPPLDDIVDGLTEAAGRELRHLVTEQAMMLELPEGVTVRLGTDLARLYAPSLASITEPNLAALVRRIDPAPETVAGSGATDWTVLEQRLHLISDLFRCFHEWGPLFEPPFSRVQVESLRAGRRPDPPL